MWDFLLNVPPSILLMKSMLKKTGKYLLFLFTLVIFIFSACVLNNNFFKKEIEFDNVYDSFNKSVNWIKENKDEIINDHNSILWWMLNEAYLISKDERLNKVLEIYREQNSHIYSMSPWSYLVYGNYPKVNSAEVLGSSGSDYTKFFIYGFSCNSELEKSELISMQQDTAFCFKNHLISPACLTHQMMGFRFMQRTGCGDPVTNTSRVSKLASYIKYQSIVDFRVIDVYLQRVLMLLDSGHGDLVNRRWIYRILKNQLDDGGWGGFQPLIPLGGNQYIGFSAKGMSIDFPRSNFHATAQGILLLAMLQEAEK